MTRRDFLAMAAAMGAGGVAAELARELTFPVPARAASLALTMFLWSGGEQGTVGRETVADFLKSRKDVTFEYHESSNAVAYPKIRAAKEANVNKPLVNFGYFNVDVTFKGDLDGMWLPLSEAHMPNMKDIFPGFRRPGDHGVGFAFAPIGIGYNTQKVKTPPTSWTDVWGNREYKGRVVLFDYLWPYTGVIMAARLNGGSEKNPDPGFEVWSKHTEQILALVTSTQQAQNLMAKGDAWITIWTKSNIQQWADAGVPVAFAVPKEGMIPFPLFFQVVVGTTAEQKAVAEAILNMLLEPARLARHCDLTGVAPASKSVKMPDRFAKDPAYQKENIEKAIHLDWGTLASMDGYYREKWDRMVKARL